VVQGRAEMNTDMLIGALAAILGVALGVLIKRCLL
jgi:hypothetical protein